MLVTVQILPFATPNLEFEFIDCFEISQLEHPVKLIEGWVVTVHLLKVICTPDNSAEEIY